MSAQPVKGQAIRWPRASMLAAIRRWYLIYNEKPRPRDWNASLASRSGDQRRLERLRSGRWPNYRTVIREFENFDTAWDAAWDRPPERPLRAGKVPGVIS